MLLEINERFRQSYAEYVVYDTLAKALKKYPDELRLIKADVEVDGKLVTMTFITNNFEWATSSIAEESLLR